MFESKKEWIIIAQGEDNIITYWNDDFAPIMDQIDRYVNAIDVQQLDLDWEEICDRVPYLKDKPWEISKEEPWREYLNSKRQINPPWIRSSAIPFAVYGWRCMLGFMRRFFPTMAFVSSMLFPQQSGCASGPKLALVPPGKKESSQNKLRHDDVGRLPVGWSNSTI
jgi:hypothetical protein